MNHESRPPDLTRLDIKGLGKVRQLGHVVADIDAGVREQIRNGIGPWMIMRHVPLRAVYLGKPSVPVIDVALSYDGDVQIELIRQHNDAPSPYLETIRTEAWGLHHRACLVDRIDDVVDKAMSRGLELVCDIRMAGSRYVYLKDGGDFIELLPNSLLMRAMFASGMRACRRCGGETQRDVIVSIGLGGPGPFLTSLPGAAAGWLQQQFGG